MTRHVFSRYFYTSDGQEPKHILHSDLPQYLCHTYMLVYSTREETMELVTAPVQAAVGEGAASTFPPEQHSSAKRPQHFSPRQKVKLTRSEPERETADNRSTLTEQSKARSDNCPGCAAQVQGHECQDDKASPGPRDPPRASIGQQSSPRSQGGPRPPEPEERTCQVPGRDLGGGGHGVNDGWQGGTGQGDERQQNRDHGRGVRGTRRGRGRSTEQESNLNDKGVGRGARRARRACGRRGGVDTGSRVQRKPRDQGQNAKKPGRKYRSFNDDFQPSEESRAEVMEAIGIRETYLRERLRRLQSNNFSWVGLPPNPLHTGILKMEEELRQLSFVYCRHCDEELFDEKLTRQDQRCGKCQHEYSKSKPGQVLMWSQDNDMHCTPVPPELQDLTPVEQSCCQRVFVVMKIYRVSQGALHLKGHCLTVLQDLEGWATSLPPMPSNLPMIFLIGPGQRVS